MVTGKCFTHTLQAHALLQSCVLCNAIAVYVNFGVICFVEKGMPYIPLHFDSLA